MSQYQIGDTANGYVLTQQGWQPLAPATTDNTWSIISLVSVAAGWTLLPFLGFFLAGLALGQARNRGEQGYRIAYLVFWGSMLVCFFGLVLIGMVFFIGVANA